MVLPHIYVQFSTAKCKKIASFFSPPPIQSRYPNSLLLQEALHRPYYLQALSKGSSWRLILNEHLTTQRRQGKQYKAFCKRCQTQNMSVLVSRQPLR